MTEEAYFSIGLAPDRLPKRPIKKVLTPPPRYRQWRILPISACLSGRALFCIDTLKGKYFHQKMNSLTQHIKNTSWKSDPFNQETKASFDLVCAEAKLLLALNQKVRFSFKKLLNLWLSRHIRTMNENDPITLSKPLKPVYIVDPCLRIQFVYEAETIAIDFHKRLLHNDGQVPEPLKPRNPLTNRNLTTFQTASALSQCKSYGYSHWTLETYKKSKYSATLFLRNNRPLLRYTTIKKIVNTPSDYDGQLTLVDFIETEFDSHDIEYPKRVFSWALHSIPHDEYIQEWRKLCIEWYTVHIFDDPDARIDEWLKITKKSGPLCDSWRELQDKYIHSVHLKKSN